MIELLQKIKEFRKKIEVTKLRIKKCKTLCMI